MLEKEIIGYSTLAEMGGEVTKRTGELLISFDLRFFTAKAGQGTRPTERMTKRYGTCEVFVMYPHDSSSFNIRLWESDWGAIGAWSGKALGPGRSESKLAVP